MWGGRYAAGPDAVMEAINVSIDVDRRLYRQDIAASKAHAAMLARHRPVVVSEYSPGLLEQVSGATGDAYLSLLLDLGYELSIVDPDGGGELIRCGRDAGRVVRFLRDAGMVQLDVLACTGRPA